MKQGSLTFLFLSILFFTMKIAKAAGPYTFNYSTSTYTPLANPNVIIPDANIASGNYSIIGLGFNFKYWDSTFNDLHFSTGAYCYFGTGSTGGFYPFYAFTKGLSDSHIAYEIDSSGGVGNKIFKLEWKHVGFLNDVTNTDFATFQIWLYQTSNKVEFHFGTWGISPSNFNSYFGNNIGIQLAFAKPDASTYYNLQGSTVAPSIVYNPTSILYLNAYPSTGTVYTFTPAASTGSSSFEEDTFIQLSPNPITDYLQIKLNNEHLSSLKIVNAIGYTVLIKNNIKSGISIDMSDFAKGTYILEICQGKKEFHQVISKY